MISNYERQVDIARDLFLAFDQEKLIRKYGLQHDADYLYLPYIGQKYRICRKTGRIDEPETRGSSVYRECRVYTKVMAICDVLCGGNDELLPPLTGQYQPIGSFVTSGASPETDAFSRKYAMAFNGKVPKLREACLSLGGEIQKELARADLTARFQVFPFLPVLLQFWDGDDEFPPKILLLWDKNTLRFLRFETTYYVQGDLLDAIQAALRPGREQ